MGRRSTFRVMLAMSFAVATSVIAVQPAAAFRILKDDGPQGNYEIGDEFGGPYGANCLYESGSKDLDKITVRAPRNVHGAYPNKTKVEWRFKVRRNAPGGASTFGVIFESSWQSDRADDAIPANGFTRRAWMAPEHPTGFFQIVIEIRWWHLGAVEGFVRGQYEWYKAKWMGGTYQNNEYCLEDY